MVLIITLAKSLVWMFLSRELRVFACGNVESLLRRKRSFRGHQSELNSMNRPESL